MNQSNILVLIGAGGHAKVCYEIAKLMNKWEKIIVLDDNLDNNFFKIEGKINTYITFKNQADYFVAIGSNKTRADILKKLFKDNCSIATLIHPNSIISKSVKIGAGTVVMPGVVVNSNSNIGQGVILNTSCTVDHDNCIEDFVHISPGVHLAGKVKIGENSWVGIGSNVIQGITVSKNVNIGAGSIVIGSIYQAGNFVGLIKNK